MTEIAVSSSTTSGQRGDVTRMTEIAVSSSTTSGQRAITTTVIQDTGSESHTSPAYLEAEKLSAYHGYGMFIGLAIVSFIIARGSLAIRQRLYKDTVQSNSHPNYCVMFQIVGSKGVNNGKCKIPSALFSSYNTYKPCILHSSVVNWLSRESEHSASTNTPCKASSLVDRILRGGQ